MYLNYTNYVFLTFLFSNFPTFKLKEKEFNDFQIVCLFITNSNSLITLIIKIQVFEFNYKC